MSTLPLEDKEEKPTWPWTDQRWENRKAGIETVIEETILLIDQIVGTRKSHIKSDEYLILNDYSKGAIAEKIFKISNQTDGLEDCKILLESLRDKVLNPLFEDFKDKFLGDNPQKLTRFTVNYVFRILLEQISTDVNLIQQGIQQRQLQICEENSSNLQITHQGFVLHVAEVLAMNAIKPALREGKRVLGLTEDTTVITLLQKNTSIRLIPYQNVMLISIPYGAMNSNGKWLSNDFLTIPHEIGHHLYWFKRNKEAESFREHLTKKVWDRVYADLEEIKKQKSDGLVPDFTELQRLQWYFHWLEEIFADAYGCRISGPIAVLSFQELLANGAPLAHERHESKHPIPALRPLIQTELLIKMKQITKSQGNKLNENWEQWVQAHWHNWIIAESIEKQEFEIAGMKTKLTGKEIMDTLDPILDIVVDSLNNLLSDPIRGEHENWSSSWETDDLDSLYKSFTEGQFISKLQSISINENMAGREITSQTPRIDITLNRGKSDLKDRIDDWVELMLFANWSKEGPEDNHGGL